MIFQWFKQKALRAQAADRLYQAALMHSRSPDFYTRLGIPDTTDGHFNLLCLHVCLVINRLQAMGRDGRGLSQALFDSMFRRMELDLREMGVGDLGVPKHMKRMMKAFNGRAHAFRVALLADDDAGLHDAVARNLYHLEKAEHNPNIAAMAGYVRAAHIAMQSVTMDDMMAGKIIFPNVSSQSGSQRRSA